MLIIHHLEKSRSQRILWLLEELGLDYQVKEYKRDPKTFLAPSSARQIHPLGKFPILEDSGTKAVESGAIIEYILEKYGQGKLQPQPGTPEAAQFRYWLHAAEGSFMPLLVMKLLFQKITQPPVPFFIRPISKLISGQVGKSYINPSLKSHLDYLEHHLKSHKYLTGNDFSAADIQMSFAVAGVLERAENANQYQNIKKYFENISSRECYKKTKKYS